MLNTQPLPLQHKCEKLILWFFSFAKVINLATISFMVNKFG